MSIRKLPTLLVNQIAAGEVIERPASVVKELVENSLDAGATRIEITIEDGGRQLMRISDDGHGIAPDELPLAVAPHATSKLESAEQLASIRTLGFRGEALASVGSVSRLRLTSRPTFDGRVAEAAGRIEVSGDDISDVIPASGPPGTVVEVRDLFYNTPARRKFMRTAGTEFGHINEAVSRIAMVQPRVAFKLVHNGRTTLDVPATDDPVRRCIEMLGKDLEEGLLAFEHIDLPERGGTRVWGLAGMPELARGSTKHQFLAINHRPVRDRNLMHAVKEAYRGLIPPDRQPVAVVFVEIDAREVDVNVHPAKAEVRFRNPSAVHGLVLAAMRQRLLGSDLTPIVTMTPGGGGNGGWPMGGGQSGGGRAGGVGGGDGAGEGQGSGAPLSANDFVSYFQRMDPTQKGFVYEQVKRAVDEDKGVFAESDTANESAGGEPPAEPALQARDILQVHDSYVVTQDEQGLLIVDQHALHERVMFEQLWQRVLGEGRSLESQRLLMPIQVRANAARQALIERMEPMLERVGIEVSPMGPETVAIQAFPSFLFDRDVEPVEFLEELLDKAEAGEIDPSSFTGEGAGAASEASLEGVLHEVLDMMACKAAVKAGDHLSGPELAALLKKREQVERASNCPHGRPTTIRLTLGDLAKHFQRS